MFWAGRPWNEFNANSVEIWCKIYYKFSTNFSIKTVQIHLFSHIFFSNFSAYVNSTEKLAVLVFIHGGAFSKGSGNDDYYGPDFIVEQGVILVTFNYRFGLFGFLSLNSPEYSGNMALKDQQLALKWVHFNIESFMGDNRKIMLLGESAGATMTHLHMLSNESRQYFSNAVLLSGSAENFWAFSEKNDHTDLVYEIANDLGKPKHSFVDLVEFLKTVPAEDIIDYGTIYPRLRRTTRFMLSPVIESA